MVPVEYVDVLGIVDSAEGSHNLRPFRLNNLPPEIYYMSEFISSDVERKLLENIYNVSRAKWTNLSNRRLQNWGGTPHIKGMVEESLPQWLAEICTMVSKLGIFGGESANHVLVNEYFPGQGIMPHCDGPLYHPAVAIVSLSGGCLLDFFRPYPFDAKDVKNEQSPDERHIGSVYLQARSLVIFKDYAYNGCLHGIKNTAIDEINERVVNSDLVGFSKGDQVQRTTRVSMTIRVVPKTIKASKIFGKTK